MKTGDWVEIKLIKTTSEARMRRPENEFIGRLLDDVKVGSVVQIGRGTAWLTTTPVVGFERTEKVVLIKTRNSLYSMEYTTDPDKV